MPADPDDWRAPITELAGGGMLEAMLAFAARQGTASGTPGRRRGWTVTVGWFRSPGVYRARVYRADPPRTAEREHPIDPAAALARALLAVAAPDERG